MNFSIHIEKGEKKDNIFVLLSIINMIAIKFVNVQYGTYLLFIYIFTCLLTRKCTDFHFLLLSLFIPNKYIQLLSVAIYIIYLSLRKKNHIRKVDFLFVLYIVCCGLLNCIIWDGFIPALLFQVAFYICLLLLLKNTNEFEVNTGEIFDVFEKMFWLQIVCVAIQYAKTHAFADNIQGTLISAHYLGIFLLLYVYIVFKYDRRTLSLQRKIIRITLASVLIIISDAKHVILIVLVSILVNKLLSKLKIKRKMLFFGVFFCIALIAGILFFNSNFGKKTFEGSLIGIYLYNILYNKKALYFLRSLENMLSLNGVFGFGVGQYGSQICLTVSKGLTHDWIPELSKYSFAIAPYRSAISGLMNEWYSKIGMPQSSFVLGYPFVSIVPLLCELGLVGYIFLMVIIDGYNKNTDMTFYIAFLMLCFFDTYLEIPCVLIMVIIGSTLLKRNTLKGLNL